MDKKNNNHSFYKEANKSILGQQQMTPKKVFKGIMKALKWLLFLFLIVITLWGCVNEFIIQTSKNLGQGVEFYQANDFVYPNMYQGYQIAGYTATDYVVDEDLDVNAEVSDKAAAIESNKTLPLDGILVPNQAKGLTFTEDKLIGFSDEDKAEFLKVKDDAYIPAYLNVSVSFNKDNKKEVEKVTSSPALYSYNLNEATVLLTGIMNYSSEEITKDIDPSDPDKGAYIYAPMVNGIPFTIPFNLIEDIDVDYTVSTLSGYAFHQLFDIDGNNEYILTQPDIDNPLFNWGDKKANDKVTSNNLIVNGTFDVATGIKTKDDIVANFTGEGLSEADISYNQFINNLAFTSGVGSVTGLESLTDEAKTKFGASSDYATTVNYSGVKLVNPSTSATAKVYGGSEVFVIPTQKGKPVQLSEESQAAVNKMRELDFTTKYDDKVDSFKYKGDSFDPETQMYGWMLASAEVNDDGTHDVMRSYDSIGEAALSEGITQADVDDITQGDSNNTDGYFFADQRRNDWGVSDGTDSTITVFDNKIKAMMNANVDPDATNDKYTQLTRTADIDGDGKADWTYKTGAKFAGMTTMEQIQTTDSSFMGVVPQVEKSDNVSWQGQERSILSDSIIPTREDAYGENRVAFVGWNDWSKAWEIQYGPLYGTVVFPLAQISMGIGEWFDYQNHPWGTLASIALIVFLTRGLGALLSLNGTKNQLKMQEVQTEVAKIKARYSKYDLKEDKKMKQKQQMEIMALYRKNDINPMGSLGTIFITMPIFISLWIIISALPAYKLVIMGNFSWAISAWSGIFGGFGALFLVYLMVGISVGLVQGVSSKLPAWLSNKRKGVKRLDEATKAANKKNNKTQNIMIGVFVFMGLTVPALFAFYWICSGLFTIFLELMRHSWRVHTAKMVKNNPAYLTPGVRMSNSVKKLFAK